MRVVALTLSACFALLAAGCGHAPGDPPQPIQRPADVTDFNALYSQNCAACHGAKGENGPAIDLSNPEYQALVDDATLRKWISAGMPGTEMMAFAQSAGGMLTDTQVNALIAGMRQAWPKSNAFPGSASPAYSASGSGDTAHGQQLYNARCQSCHQSATQDITSPEYLTLVGNQALRTIIIAGRPDIGQPDYAHLSPNGQAAPPLSSQDVTDLVAYLGSLRPGALAAKSPDQSSKVPAHSGRSGGQAHEQ